MKPYFCVENLAVGYNGAVLIHDINFEIEKGAILTLIGPNGAGKSTILKTLTRQLPAISGTVRVEGKRISEWSPREMSREIAVVLTDRIRPELMTCAELVAMGRYPYTNMFGKLTGEDVRAVEEALSRVHALDLARRDFTTLSDGQRQRVLLARAICQNPNIIVLDEPTAYLDIRHKTELLDILREMAQEKKITVVMSLHEIDLAMKISDYLMCVKGETTFAFGVPGEIINTCSIEQLYEMENGSYNTLFGSVELMRPRGAPRIFVVAGNGRGIPFFRELQKRQIPFAAGVLYENDVDWQVASALGGRVVSAPAFRRMDEKLFQEAADSMLRCGAVLDAGAPICEFNEMNGRLIALAREKNVPVLTKLP